MSFTVIVSGEWCSLSQRGGGGGTQLPNDLHHCPCKKLRSRQNNWEGGGGGVKCLYNHCHINTSKTCYVIMPLCPGYAPGFVFTYWPFKAEPL